jgi:hypothetical protein
MSRLFHVPHEEEAALKAEQKIIHWRPAVLAGIAVAALSLPACKFGEAKQETKAPVKPIEQFKPLTNEQDDTYKVGPFTPKGPAVPKDAKVIELNADVEKQVGSPVLLVPLGETYLAQVTPLLAALDDADSEVWLKHPEGAIAYRVKLRDEKTWQKWIDEPVAGKFRIIHRADGFELQTNMGKLPGFDPNGPSVPVRGGRMDLPTLRKGFERVKSRFKEAPDVCFVPSMGLAMADITTAMAANFSDQGEPIFSELCLVYPRR